MSQVNDGPTMIEQEIDVALKMLAEVQAPAAMESRIRRSLGAAAATPQIARRGWPVWVPAICVAVGVILVAVILPSHVRHGIQRSAGETARTTVADAAPARQRMDGSARIAPEGSRKIGAVQMVHATVPARRIPRYRHAANLFNYPLTRQEKLLVQFARTATPAELQNLNPEYQAKIEAEQEAAFAAYVNSGSSSDAQEVSATNSNTTQE